jgi:NADH:ubiquinone oxidoreductase subunit F (NADH-binding)
MWDETALIHQLKENVVIPRPRPPFPAENGLWDKAFVLNNVETYAKCPFFTKGGRLVSHTIGTEKSKGTKVFVSCWRNQ